MTARVQTATRWLLLVGLQVPALLTLQSCNIDRTEPVQTQAEHSQRRPVLGSPPERTASKTETRARSSRVATPAAVQPDKSQDRSRTRDLVNSRSRTASTEAQRPPLKTARQTVKDPGERGVGDPSASIASNDAPRETGLKPFLHYQPAGSPVRDSGERPATAPDKAQVSPSTKVLSDLIHRWADTMLRGDLRGHMSLYAATLDRFHGSSNVSREAVRASKERLLSGLAGVRKFEMLAVRLLPSRGDSIIAEFRIDSDAEARGLAGWYRLHVRPVNDQWRIHGEEKLQAVSRRGEQ